MKRKSLLFLLLMAVFAPWAANAQETLTVYGDGTQTNNAYVPMYGGYFDDYTKSEFIIPATKLADMDGGTITSMKFYIYSVSTYGSGWDNTHQVVFLKEVEATITTLSAWSGTDGATIVFDGTFTVPASTDTEFEIIFTEPYEYNGGSLIVGVYNTDDGSYRTVNWYGESVTGASGGASNGSSLDGVTFSQRNFIPKTTFTYEPASTDCPNPKTLVASDVTAHGATMTWTMDDETAEYQFNLEYKKTTEETWTRIGLGNTRTYTFTNVLDPETEYQVRIQTACTPENDKWKNGSNFTTLVACPAPTNLAVTDGSITANEATLTWTGTSESYVVMIGQENLLLNANFEDNAIPAALTNSTSYPWTVMAGGANGSDYCIVPGNHGVNSSDSDLTFEVTLDNPATVSFWAKISSEGSDYGRFLIDGTQKLSISGTSSYTTWTKYEYELTAGSHTLIWRYHKDISIHSGSDYFYVDDIIVSAGVASWTEYTTTAQTYPFENLTPNRSYQVKVKGNCGSEGYSAETEPVSFTTLESCPAPTGLAIVEGYPTAHGVSFTWNYEEGEVFEYSLPIGNVTDPAMVTWNTTWYAGDAFPIYDNQPADADRTFWLRKKCGDSDFSDPVSITFHFLEACPAPTGFTYLPNSVTGHTVDLTWEGTSESYQVAYRTAAYTDGTEETFDNNSIPTGWTKYIGLLSDVMGGTALSSTTSGWSFGTKNNVFNSHSYINIWSTSTKYWLVSPQTEMPNGAVCSFDLALTVWSSLTAVDPTSQLDDKFVVLISTDDMATWTILRQWDNDANTTGDIYAVYNDIACSATGEKVNIDLSAYAGENVYIAFYGESTQSGGDNALHIDNVAIGTPVPAGDWQYKTNVTEVPCQLTGLLAERKYEATLQGDCGDEGPSTVVGPITFTTGIACPAPTGFALEAKGSSYATLNWNADADAWQMEITNVTMGGNPGIIDIANNNQLIVNEGVVTYQVNLNPETEYSLRLRANCTSANDGYSEWTAPLTFTTLAACALENVTVSNIGHYTATVDWTGESQEGFTVKYRVPAGEDALFKEDFESASSFANWTFTSMNAANAIGTSNGAGRLETAAHESSFGFRFSSYSTKSGSNETYDQYLVSPELTVTGELKFYAKKYGDYADYLYVGYSTTTSDVEAFTWDEEALALTTSWNEFTHELPNDVKYIGFHYFGDCKWYVYVDDITIGAFEVPAGDWQTVTTDETTADLNELTAGIKYDLTVVPNCDETLASEIQQFTTVSPNQKYFLTEGNWSTTTNWEPIGAPTIDQTVTLFANTTIESGCVAEAMTIDRSTYSITIEDGGQLKCNSSVYATVKKNIAGYGEGVNVDGDPSGYYLIANPITSNYTPKADGSDGILVGNYDLYSWDYTQADEWRNYKANQFSNLNSAAYNSYGYLYANEQGTDLIFEGNIKAANASLYRTCNATSYTSYDFPGWFLLGNAFVCNAYLAAGSATGNTLPFIRMNTEGDGFENVAAGGVIAPLEGVFFQASSEEGGFSGSVYVTTTEPTVPSKGQLNMNLRKDNKQLDNAILVFGGDQQLGKMTFRANSSKIYMPVDGKDYAIVSTENMGEMPVNFKAENNGTYTLSFNAEEVSFAYLHLIDNMTGVETDLLANPSYTFDARTTDYASRFRLVFATGNNSNEDSFAFFSNGSFVINNEGEATLQVVDVMGRIVKSETINGCANVNVNAAPGVYMLRLVNGNDVKVQKVVVR